MPCVQNWYTVNCVSSSISSITSINYVTVPVTWSTTGCNHYYPVQIIPVQISAEREAARLRAEELLLTMLTAEQIVQYRAHGCFETPINDKIYRIRRGRTNNVELLEDGKAKYRYCVHPESWTPDPDVMLVQLLMLHTDEAEFLRLANRTVLA
jgi:hypothetical protein